MNWDAYYERINNNRHIQGHYRQGHLVLEVEREEVSFMGRPWLKLSDRDKRKFENNLFMEHADKRIPLKVLYL